MPMKTTLNDVGDANVYPFVEKSELCDRISENRARRSSLQIKSSSK